VDAPGRGGRSRDGDRLPERRDRRLRRALRRRHAAQPDADPTREGKGVCVTSQAEIARRYANVRAQAQEDGLDAVVVAGSEYTGFEGAVRYLSGFRILHRY